MSRHELQPLPGTKAADIVVGWDRPLETFFAQVHDRGGRTMLWAGCALGALPNAAAAIAIVAPFAVVPPALEQQLEADRRATEFIVDGPALATLKRGGVIR